MAHLKGLVDSPVYAHVLMNREKQVQFQNIKMVMTKTL